MLKSYWTIAWRNIARHKTFTVINVLGLALGICFCLIIFLVTSYEFSFDHFHPDGDRIYRVGMEWKHNVAYEAGNASRVMPSLPAAIRREVPGVTVVTGFYDGWNPTVKVVEPKTKSGYRAFTAPQSSWAETILVDPDYFNIFNYDWLAGNPASMGQPFQLVLSESRARRFFGNTAPASLIGKELVFDDSIHLYISGIVKDWTENSDFVTQEFVSLSTIKSSKLRETYSEDNGSVRAFVKLAPGTKPERVGALLSNLVKKNMPNFTQSSKMILQPLPDVHFNGDFPQDDFHKAHKPTLYGVMALAVFILLLAVINFINLSTAQSIRRAREVGVRKVLGSGRNGLTLQFLTETLVVVLFSVVLAVCFVKPCMDLFRNFIPSGVTFRLNPPVLLFLLGLILFTSLLAGYYPARVLSAYRPVKSLKGSVEYSGNRGWTLRRGLIVFQFTISLAFIVCTLVVSNQIRYMLKTDYGFKTDAILTVETHPKYDLRLLGVFKDKLRELPGVRNFTQDAGAPIGWGHSSFPFVYKGPNPVRIAETDFGDETFIPFYQMRILAGRNMHHSDSLGEILINETAARSFGFSSPDQAVGKFLYVSSKQEKGPFPIVGVVADYHTESLHEPIHSLAIAHLPDMERSIDIRLAMTGKNAADMQKTLMAIREAFKSAYPDANFGYGFIDDSIRNMYQDEMSLSMLVRSAMLVTIFISCLGLFGVSLFVVEKRTREIGIRKILGASVSNIVILLNREFVGLVILSILIASPIAWWAMQHWLDGYAYRVRLSPPLFLLAGICGIGIALLTVSFQSIRAARANPVKTLKTE